MYYSPLPGLFFFLSCYTKPFPVLKNILNILIVDDNPNFIKRMISILDDVQFSKKINIACDFDSAMELMAATRHDILLLDINMPGKSGIDLLRHIREQQSASEVIMLTNHSQEFYREQCRVLGARYFLDKSNDFLQVPEIVNTYCQRNIETSQPDEYAD